MKISISVNLMLVVLIASALASGLLVRHNLMDMTDDGKIVNFSGKIRGGAQRLVKLEFVKQHQEADKVIGSIEKIINGILNGDTSLGIPKADEDIFITEMKKVDSGWKKLRQHITEFRANPALAEQLVKESEDFFKSTNEATNVAEKLSVRHINTVYTVLILIFILNLFISALV
ncbi:type IV pili methyl-accepting chemotaxis transducer N-terminal domain-containing protein [Candidatus Magnetomonas plexicatena]|uniref:type IV pili methyl-accepting chemotaxis transducer N-terminal domain-containing protein n=1 Tax=Candidatus Magnetomonas plexicatena TaxID=2552947 RepID=UPI001102DF98|nr:hypothetical protein E2O03_001315 [Nitrospirales bacterium LBB_01]